MTAQKPNYDESKVPEFELPALTRAADGTAIDRAGWPERREELKRLFEQHVYGCAPAADAVQLRVEDVAETELAGARLRQVVVVLSRRDRQVRVNLAVFLPKGDDGPCPAFLALNFKGNHTVHADPSLRIPTSWVPNDKGYGVEENRASAGGRGKRAGRWPVAKITGRGYALATAYYGDIDPDVHDGFENGIHALFADEERDGASWGSVSGWAFGLSRLLDVLASMDDVDGGRVAVLGHSRLGKTALWAGAADPRFAIVISNNSGCGGAALSRRAFGETVKVITERFPHWFCSNFSAYGGRENALPVDQHGLIALMAPRPVYVASAAGDRWADPRGEFLATRAAQEVYDLFELEGLSADAEFPEPGGTLNSGTVAYHLRDGRHDLKPWDWDRYLDFADRHFGR